MGNKRLFGTSTFWSGMGALGYKYLYLPLAAPGASLELYAAVMIAMGIAANAVHLMIRE